MESQQLIADAHLDLAYNALRGRDLTLPASQIPADAEGTPAVGLPDLRAAGVALMCGTLYVDPYPTSPDGYRTAQEAHDRCLAQLNWYEEQQRAGRLRIVRTGNDLADPSPQCPATCILMEGADGIRTSDDVQMFVQRGVRLVGLAWKQTRYAGGTGNPGPLTPAGRELVPHLDRHRIIHDLSHLAEASFWELLELSSGPVLASHSNCRNIIPTDRHLTDEMIQAVAQRGGVIGVNFFDKFLIPPPQYKTRRATLEDVVAQVRHLCDVLGDSTHVCLGTDMDGGFGREELPRELLNAGDLPLVAQALMDAGFDGPSTNRIMFGNLLAFFRRSLP